MGTIKTQCSFKFSHYEQTLQSAIAKGYKIIKLINYKINRNKIIFLRHDVDFDLSQALKIAQIERSLGINSSFFIRMHGNYNPFSFNNYLIIKKIQSMGHEIGLHHELGFAKFTNEDESDLIIKGKFLLESIIGAPIKGISFHQPSLWNKMNLDVYSLGFEYDAYQDTFTKHVKYISDSCSRWHDGCMCQFIGKTTKLCILTHPFWWFEEVSMENY